VQRLGPVQSFEDVPVTNGPTYYCRVSARNAVGSGPLSEEVSATPNAAPPSRPPPPLSGDPPGIGLGAGGSWALIAMLGAAAAVATLLLVRRRRNRPADSMPSPFHQGETEGAVIATPSVQPADPPSRGPTETEARRRAAIARAALRSAENAKRIERPEWPAQ
jgi:hypothetical protein